MIRKFLRGFGYAGKGVVRAVAEQLNLKVQLFAALTVIVAGVWYHITSVEWCMLILSIGLVLSLELVNSAIESLVDLVTKERKPLAGKVKDIAAGAVLVASICAAAVGITIFYKYIFL